MLYAVWRSNRFGLNSAFYFAFKIMLWYHHLNYCNYTRNVECLKGFYRRFWGICLELFRLDDVVGCNYLVLSSVAIRHSYASNSERKSTAWSNLLIGVARWLACMFMNYLCELLLRFFSTPSSGLLFCYGLFGRIRLCLLLFIALQLPSEGILYYTHCLGRILQGYVTCKIVLKQRLWSWVKLDDSEGIDHFTDELHSQAS